MTHYVKKSDLPKFLENHGVDKDKFNEMVESLTSNGDIQIFGETGQAYIYMNDDDMYVVGNYYNCVYPRNAIVTGLKLAGKFTEFN